MSDLNAKHQNYPLLTSKVQASKAISCYRDASIAKEANDGKSTKPLVDARNSVVLLTPS